MSKRWPGKYVIGLTGNIATGKSVVRKMLEHVGALGLDADALAHQALAKGGPAYGPVSKLFGEWVLTPDGEINRARLGRVVFADPEALAALEGIIHPLVAKGLDFLIVRSRANTVVVEAIKLIESGLAKDCDALWVVTASDQVQMARLMEKRKMSPTEAKQRLAAQSSQTEKIKAGSFIIDNSGSFDDTWAQVQAGFGKLLQPAAAETTQVITSARKTGALSPLTVRVRRGKPNDAAAIADFIKVATNGQRTLARTDIMAAFGDKAYFLAEADGRLAAIVGWKIENLVTRADELYLANSAPWDKLAPPLIDMLENASKELQCEVALIFVPLALAPLTAPVLGNIGYTPQVPDKLGVPAWKEAAAESMPPNTGMFFKKLREDRVLRPV
jgi:dephospho-CoA kinase